MSEPNQFRPFRPFAPATLRGTLTFDEPMARHVSWRAGGRAARCYIPADAADLGVFLRSLVPSEPMLFIGLGSNTLVRDGGFAGTVVLMHNTHGAIRIKDGLLHAEAGVACPKLARFAAMQGLAGAAFLAGIPGTIGGALAMNAGCYGAQTWDVARRVRTIDRHGDFHERRPEDFELGYRHVALRTGELGADEWFVEGSFEFSPGEPSRERDAIRDLLAKRIASQPLNLPNAGSVFRNPPGDHAARLIEAAGLKGRTIGGASVSTKHANFIVNPSGHGSAEDIESLIETVRVTVLARFAVALVPEVRIVGERVGRKESS